MQCIKTVYLNWDLPLLPAITKQLLPDSHDEVVDLSSTMVIVPTVQSGRRLREALALDCRGLFPPNIVTPNGFLEFAIRDLEVADDAAMFAAWTTVLKSLDYTEFGTLFPIIPEPSIEWQLGMSKRFVQLRNELGEEGLNFRQVAELNAKTGHEPERWRQLARLESLYLDQLNTYGLQDPKEVRRNAAQDYSPTAQFTRIILAATPDPQPLVIQAFESAAQKVPFEIWVYGPEDAHFDCWGRPISKHWCQRSLEFETWEASLQAVDTPKTAAAFVVESMQDKKPESVLLGLADYRLNPVIANALNRANIPNYDPEGAPLCTGGPGQLAQLLCRLDKNADIATIRTLLQHPDVQEWLNTEHKAEQLLQQLDRLFERHLPSNLATLIHFAAQIPDASDLQTALDRLKQLAESLTSTGSFAAALAQALQIIYAEKQVRTSTESGIPWKERAEAIGKKLNTVAKAEATFPKLPKDLARLVFQQSLSDSRVYPTRPHEAHDLLGWLELLWNDAPHLILVGLNENCVPESIVGDAFLPETLREQLGLRTNAQRFARDAYILEALCRRRANKQGRIDILVPRYTHDHQPLKPSRLLFQGSSDQLIRRTRQLFLTNNASNTVEGDFRSAWTLKPPPDLTLPNVLSVSALKDYLQCPFRFFLRHILKMRPVDVETRELNPAAFGTLFHDTVAKLKAQTLNHSTQASDLIKKLQPIAEHLFNNRYGDQLSFALRLQHEALLTRIIAFAERQVDDIEQNGRLQILNTEEPFEISLNDFILNGRIDRVDQREKCLELIDYKTGNQAVSPAKAHLALVGKKTRPEHLPKEAFFENNGKEYYWTDLQLPLYKLAKNRNQDEPISLAYFNLSQTSEKSGIVRWEDFTRSHLDSARACAEAILRQIRAGVFWPPGRKIHESYDDFAALFPDGIENSVDATAFMHYKFS